MLTRQIYNRPRVVKFIAANLSINTQWAKNCWAKNYLGRKICVTKKDFYACHIHHLQWFVALYITKASCEIAASTLKDFLKGRKSAKNALIMHNYAN